MSDKIITTAVLLATLALQGAPALAEAPQQQTARSGPAPGSTASSRATSASQDSGELQEIIVTAMKFRQDVQKTSATVTVVSSGTLTKLGATDVRALTQFSPMAHFGNEGQNTVIFMRGIGQETPDDANDPGVALYVNQVYMPIEALSSSLFDIDRVEIVSGPQGTLYGRDAVGGAVNIYTSRPTDRLSMQAMLEGGNYGLAHATAVLNAPITDSLWTRMALNYERHDGYLSYGGGDENVQNARWSLLYAPSGRFSNLIRAEYDHLGGRGDAAVVTPICTTPSDCLVPTDPWYEPAAGNYDNRRVIYTAIDEADVKFDNGISLASIAGYVDLSNRFNSPIGDPRTLESWSNLSTDFVPGPLPPNPLYGGSYETFQAKKQWSEELRLAQDAQRYHWVAGLYWLHFNTHTPPSPFLFPQVPASLETLPGLGCGPGDVGPVSGAPNPGPCFASEPIGSDNVINDSYAAYADGTWSVLSWLHLDTGVRMSVDHKRTVGFANYVSYGDVVGAAPTDFAASNTWRHLDWKAGLQGDIPQLPDSHFYAKAETSYVEGGVNDAPGTANSPSVTGSSYEPEKVLAFTVGLKNRFWNEHLQLNDEVFYYDYEDLQLAAFNATAGGTTYFNAPRAVSYGDQLDVELQATRTTNIGVDVGLLRAYIKEAVLPPSSTYLPGNMLSNLAIPPAWLDATSLGGPNGSPIDYSGYSLPYSPRVSLSAHLEQTIALASGATLEAYLATHYSAKDWADYTHQPGSQQPSYTKTDATLTYTSPSGQWYVAIWGKNLENTWRGSTYGPTSVYGIAAWFPGDPRTFGGRVGVRF